MPPISPNSDLNSIVNQMNQNIAQQNTNKITTTYKDETGVIRIILGKLPDGTHGIVVSKPGYDAREIFT
jgi:hypothetical protein